jgi:hypothetical protein
MLTLIAVAAGVAVFETAALRYGSDSRIDTPEGACGTPMDTSGRRWL